MLVIFLGIGFLGAILMFVGDMALYYSKQDYVTDGTLRPIIAIMKNLSRRRLYIGGMLGPIAAFGNKWNASGVGMDLFCCKFCRCYLWRSIS